MFVDSSALVAIMTEESEGNALVARLAARPQGERVTSPLVVWESALAVARKLRMEPEDALAVVGSFLAELEVSIAPVPPGAAPLAVQAFSAYGKGRHRASLNFGDCFSYAMARELGVPLLYKGDDFTLTDIEAG
jgi:ribonuclease VapC